MSFTGKQVVDDVRPLVNDKDQTTWADPAFLPFLNECILLLYTDHPECRLTTAGALTAYAVLAKVGDVVPLNDLYRPAVFEYLAYRYFDSDAGDTRDKSRAAEHLQRFTDLIGPSK
ncbi:MAG: DUF6682 family protein [Patescibacteria group bacterium]